MLGEGAENLRAADQLFQHLGRGFAEIRLHGDSADPSPLLLARQNHVHKVAKLVEESLHIADVH